MKDVYDNLYSSDKYGKVENKNQANWLMSRNLSGIRTAVDFGCGRGHAVNTLTKLGIKTTGVDFADSLVDTWGDSTSFINGDVRNTNLDKTFDLVVCHDVLEHISMEDIDDAMDNLARHTGKLVSLAIANHPDVWNGKELHLIQEGVDWWRKKVEARWEIIEYESRLGGRLHLFWCRTK